MHLDRGLNVFVGVLEGSAVVLHVVVQLVEAALNLGAAGQLLLCFVVTQARVPLRIIAAGDRVLVALDELSNHGPKELHLLLALRGHRLTQLSQLVLDLLRLDPDVLDNHRQVLLDVEEHDLGQLRGEVTDTKQRLVHTDVSLVVCKIMTLFLVCLVDGKLIDDVLLATVLDANVAVKQRHFLVLEHVFGVGAMVHDVDLGDDTNGPRA